MSNIYEPISRNIGKTGGMNTSQLSQGEVLAFTVTYHDKKESGRWINYIVKYYAESDSIEMIEEKNRKLFLKKCKRPASMSTKDLHVNGKITIHGRAMTISAYQDAFTESRCQARREEAFIVTEMGAGLGDVFDAIDRNDMQIKRVNAVYEGNTPVVAISAVGPNATNTLERDGVRTSDTTDRNAYFNGSKTFAGTLNSSTCVIIQPSAVAADQTGGIIRMILSQGYEISAMGMFELNQVQAAEFLEVYKDVVPFYNDKVSELSSGPCIALEVRAENAVQTFRMTAGPWDVDMARALATDSIRGAYGVNNSQNAVHCTELPKDAFDEVNYFFGNRDSPPMLKPCAAVN